MFSNLWAVSRVRDSSSEAQISLSPTTKPTLGHAFYFKSQRLIKRSADKSLTTKRNPSVALFIIEALSATRSTNVILSATKDLYHCTLLSRDTLPENKNSPPLKNTTICVTTKKRRPKSSFCILLGELEFLHPIGSMLVIRIQLKLITCRAFRVIGIWRWFFTDNQPIPTIIEHIEG